MFVEGKMDASFYIEILNNYLLLFIQSNFPSTHRFMQDNDPKHTSRKAQDFFRSNRITWWRTPPESPDCNLIENLWHELKEYIRREVKPKSKQELIDGIEQFWTIAVTSIIYKRSFLKWLKFKERQLDTDILLNFLNFESCNNSNV